MAEKKVRTFFRYKEFHTGWAQKMNAKAVHAKRGEHHAVQIAALRVLVCREGDLWTAQGVDIDYVACGNSLEDVQDRFERGLAATVDVNLQKFDSIDRLLRFAPEAEWRDMDNPTAFQFDMLTVHQVKGIDSSLSRLPFDEIAYLQKQCAAG